MPIYIGMKDERLPFKLLTNEWDKVKCTGRPTAASEQNEKRGGTGNVCY